MNEELKMLKETLSTALEVNKMCRKELECALEMVISMETEKGKEGE